MQEYVFVGLECEVHGIAKLDKFGQRITLDGNVAANVIAGGGGIIPADTFDALGFTADELKLYAVPGTRQNAPDETKAKFMSAAVAFCALREEK